MRMPKHLSFLPRLAIITSATLLCCHAVDCYAAPGPYRLSAHGGSNDVPIPGQGAKRSSIPNAAGNCTHCHEQHASLGGAGPADYMLFNTLTGNTLCNTCHNNSTANGADDIATQISKTGGRHDPNYGPGAALCNDCHNSHVAQKTNHNDPSLAPSNLVGANSPLLSVKGTPVNNWSAGTPTAGNEDLGTLSLKTPETITREYELCFSCHAVQPPIAANLDVGIQFNPNNFSIHPVATQGNTWKNSYLRDTNQNALESPWNINANKNATMYCSDCHGSESSADSLPIPGSAPQGPHGSTIKYMLKAGPGTGNTLFDYLCLKCHKDPGASGYVNTSWQDNWGTALVGDHSLPAHQSTVTNPSGTNNTYGCLACHGSVASSRISSIHGANFVGNNGGGIGRPSYAFLVSDLTNNYYTGGNPFTPGNRFCSTVNGSGCHTGNAAYAY